LKVASRLLLMLLLFSHDAVTLLRLFIEQWLDADATSFGPEVTA
jgi:hypothetical protein